MTQTHQTRTPVETERALSILARSVYRELRAAGYGRHDVVAFANAVLDLVHDELREGASQPPAAPQAAE